MGVADPLLRLDRACVRYAGAARDAVDDVSFTVAPGEIFALLGPSGSGKTTVLRAIAGFEPLVRGSMLLRGAVVQGDGVFVPPARRELGFVFQDHALFPHLTVEGNIAFGLTSLPAAERRSRVAELLAALDLEGLGERTPHELSGGERQRVALARAMAPQPSLLLMDEPFDSLDKGLRETVRRYVHDRLKEMGTTALLVTHDQEEALSFAERLGVMCAGCMEQIGRPEDLYLRPANRFVADFLGDTNFIEGEAGGASATTPLGQVRLDQTAHGPVVLSVRPEHLELMELHGGAAAAEVVLREYKGHDITLRVRFGERLYTVIADYRCRFDVGDRVGLRTRETAVVLQQRVDEPGPSPQSRSGSRG
ncbi:MAG: ABC transporter ATP-binding protein [Planctomycetota bacterium]|nr:ABC transporter ATP-binding protein [Planctomycetota bacterium]